VEDLVPKAEASAAIVAGSERRTAQGLADSRITQDSHAAIGAPTSSRLAKDRPEAGAPNCPFTGGSQDSKTAHDVGALTSSRLPTPIVAQSWPEAGAPNRQAMEGPLFRSDLLTGRELAHALTRPSDTLSPSDGEREGMRRPQFMGNFQDFTTAQDGQELVGAPPSSRLTAPIVAQSQPVASAPGRQFMEGTLFRSDLLAGREPAHPLNRPAATFSPSDGVREEVRSPQFMGNFQDSTTAQDGQEPVGAPTSSRLTTSIVPGADASNRQSMEGSLFLSDLPMGQDRKSVV